ncbi:MAG TPA: trehalose-phosphatase [Gemmatimonadaceae bacterium]|nr:trehalose-phosphatase [Gemmatimonadaceae bacterium]
MTVDSALPDELPFDDAPSSGGAALPAALGAAARERLAGAPLLALLDVDGTLAPIVAHPSAATVPDDTRRAVAALVARPRTHVAVVSGRAAADAARVVGVDGVWVIGNHGAERVAPDGGIVVDPLVAPFARRVEGALRQLQPAVDAVPGAELEDKRWTMTLHYRRVDDDAAAAALGAAAAAAAHTHGLALREGKKIFELRPTVRVDKGVASLRLAADLGALAPGASVLYAGDDATDEDAFRALRNAVPRAVTVRVGAGAEEGATTTTGGPTAAEFTVADLHALRALLEQIVQLPRREADVPSPHARPGR